jgi:hypothetical protein
MPHLFTPAIINDLETIISPPRFGTYIRETSGDRDRAMQLYCWNSDVSSAFYHMLQFCELTIRNAAVEAIEAEFGRNWHLSRGFKHTLPVPSQRSRRYYAITDLENCASRLRTAGKVVAELKFAFWQSLFVSPLDARLWDKHLAGIFPGLPGPVWVPKIRAKLYNDIETIRKLRNRIAHHEPIFARNLAEDHQRIREIILWRRASAAHWLDGVEQVTGLLAVRP